MSERKVLRLPSTEEPMAPDMGSPMPPPPMDNNMEPPMGGSPNVGMNDFEMGDPMGGPMGGEQPNPFDTNFDPGVEADEETDPKRFIQQLTGKLSQSLRSYNETLPHADTDLCKYVAGMILKQTTDGLTPADTKEIMDKMNGGDAGPEPDTQPQPEMGEMEQMPGLGESVDRIGGLDNYADGADKTDRRKPDKNSIRQRAFVGKRF